MEMHASPFFKVVTSSLSLKMNLLNHLKKIAYLRPSVTSFRMAVFQLLYVCLD